MPVFYLEPANGNVSAPNWAATSLQEGMLGVIVAGFVSK
jgi:hypothetical protein